MITQFKRVCQVLLPESGRNLEYPGMSLEFEVPFAKGLPNPVSTVKVYNPAPETVEACKPRSATDRPLIRVMAGYESQSATLINGKITKLKYGPANSGIDRLLELTVVDRSLKLSTPVNQTWSGAIPARRVITELLAPFGVVPVLRFGKEKTYTGGYAITGVTLQKALEDIATDTESAFWQYAGRVMFMPLVPQGFGQAVVLDGNYTLESQEHRRYKIKAVFNPDIGAGSLASLRQDSGPVLLEVQKGTHSFSTFGSAKTEFEAQALA